MNIMKKNMFVAKLGMFLFEALLDGAVSLVNDAEQRLIVLLEERLVLRLQWLLKFCCTCFICLRAASSEAVRVP